MKDSDSPFHAGERAVQRRVGAAERMAAVGRRVIADRLGDAQRAFLETLPFVVVAARDSAGRPWASLLVGDPGFATAPEPRRLSIGAVPVTGDPLYATLRAGARVGLLAIEFETRRRTRVNGVVTGLTDRSIELRVEESFGNCPRYIQTRAAYPAEIERGVDAPAARRLDRLDDEAMRLVAAADTLFIASGGAREVGVDVSHRGGRPGFVRVDDRDTLTVPDLPGNHYFNTLGNLELDAGSGLLFVDFAGRHLLHLSGAAEVLWDAAALRAYPGAERLVRFRVGAAVFRPRSLALRFRPGEASPALVDTGPWSR